MSATAVPEAVSNGKGDLAAAASELASQTQRAANAGVPTGPKLDACLAAFDAAKRETNDQVVESDDFITALFDAIASRTHVSAVGPGGVGKTFASNITGKHFSVPTFYVQFRNDMKREEVFGPLSMRALQNDLYVHVTTGMLPEAVIANLDEIADAGRFNRQLLNILNERWFKNGHERLNVPLATAIATSNFVMDSPDLAALYDRFAQRIFITDELTSTGFEKVLTGAVARMTDEAVGIVPETSYTQVTPEMLAVIQHAVLTCKVGPNIVKEIVALRTKALAKSLNPSPRRYIDGLKVAMARAVQADRDHVTEDDLRAFALVLPTTDDDVTLAAELTNHLRDKSSAAVDMAVKALAQVRSELKPVRDLIEQGRVKEAPFQTMTDARINAITATDQIDAITGASGPAKKKLDAVRAEIQAEIEFIAKVAMGQIK
jgi:MoxR-like ATPase